MKKTMTSEEKQLLIKDLCARLPYGIKGLHRDEVQTLDLITIDGCYQVNGYGAWFDLSRTNFKPYLRPLSSMTEEEELDFILKCDSVLRITEKKHTCILSIEEIDWLLAHHFDYRDLIPMGLALEAPEDMYKEN